MKTKIFTPEESYCLSTDSLRMKLMTAELTDRQTRKTISQRRIDQLKIFFHYNLQPRLLLSLRKMA